MFLLRKQPTNFQYEDDTDESQQDQYASWNQINESPLEGERSSDVDLIDPSTAADDDVVVPWYNRDVVLPPKQENNQGEIIGCHKRSSFCW